MQPKETIKKKIKKRRLSKINNNMVKHFMLILTYITPKAEARIMANCI